MRALLVLTLAASCTHPKPTPIVAPPPKHVDAPPPKVEPVWPVPMRVVAWTDAGPVTVGTLPDHPPATMPARYYVEPLASAEIDEATFDKIVVALRTQHVYGLSMRGRAVAAWLPKLRGMTELKALVLDDTDVVSLDAIDFFLERLYAERTGFDAAAVGMFGTKQPELTVIDLQGTRVTDDVTYVLPGLVGLHAIDLSNTAITDVGGERLRFVKSLDVIDLGGTAVGKKTIEAIATLPHVRHLFLDGTQVGSEVGKLAPLAPTLERIDVSGLEGPKLTDKQLDWLAKAPNLVEAGLGGAQIHDPLVASLIGLPLLRELRISEAPITLKVAHSIAKTRPELEEIDLGDTVADDATAAELLALPNMRLARFDHTKITDAALRGKISTNLVELYLSRNALTDAGLAILDAAPNLEGLGLGETKIGAATIARIGKLVHLHTLVLSKVRGVEDFTALGSLEHLLRLYLDETYVDDEDFDAFTNLDELRTLHLGTTSIGNGALAVIRSFTALEELTIGDTRVTGAKIADLSSWPRLRVLSVLGLEIKDAMLPSIAQRTSLQTLDLSATDITDPTPLLALSRLRTLGLSQTKLSTTGLASAKALAKRGVHVVQ